MCFLRSQLDLIPSTHIKTVGSFSLVTGPASAPDRFIGHNLPLISVQSHWNERELSKEDMWLCVPPICFNVAYTLEWLSCCKRSVPVTLWMVQIGYSTQVWILRSLENQECFPENQYKCLHYLFSYISHFVNYFSLRSWMNWYICWKPCLIVRVANIFSSVWKTNSFFRELKVTWYNHYSLGCAHSFYYQLWSQVLQK